MCYKVKEYKIYICNYIFGNKENDNVNSISLQKVLNLF